MDQLTLSRAHYHRIKERLVEVFCPASIAWREAVVQKGLELISRAIEVCQDEKWEANSVPEPAVAADRAGILAI